VVRISTTVSLHWVPDIRLNSKGCDDAILDLELRGVLSASYGIRNFLGVVDLCPCSGERW